MGMSTYIHEINLQKTSENLFRDFCCGGIDSVWVCMGYMEKL